MSREEENEMKKWKKACLGALCAAALLAGCGAQNGGTDQDGPIDDTPDIVDNNTDHADTDAAALLDAVRAVNAPRELLKEHDTVTVKIQGTDGDGNVTYTARVQYTGGTGEDILMNSHYRYSGDSGVGEDELWGEGNGGVYASRMASDNAAGLNIFPVAGEGEQYILDVLPQCPVLSGGEEETIDEPSEQDGALLLSVTTSYTDFTDYYFTTLYYIDPATNGLLAMSVTDYSVDEGGLVSEMGTTLYNWSYDEPYNQEPYKSGRYLLNDVVYATDDTRPACLLTVCLPAKEGGEDWWVNEYHVARGTYVNICCRSGCTLYADAALTQPIDDTVSIDTNGEEMTVYVVPDVPLN